MNADVFLLLIILTEARVLCRKNICKRLPEKVQCLLIQSESVFKCEMKNSTNCGLRPTIKIAKGSSSRFKMCNISTPWNDTNRLIGFRCSCDLSSNLVPYTIRFLLDNCQICTDHQLFLVESFIPSNPTDVKVTSINSTTIRITANFNNISLLPPTIQKTVNITFYKNQNVLTVSNTFRINRTILNKSIGGFQPYTKYKVEIRWNIMDSIYCSEPSYHVITTNATKPTAAPEIIKGGYSISLDNRIALYWKKIQNERVNGPKLQYYIYKVIHCEQLSDCKPISDLKCRAPKHDRTLYVNGSKISAILPKNVQKGDAVMIRSKNDIGISDEHHCIHVKSNDNVFRKITSLEVKTINSTHYHLKWQETGAKNRGSILIYWCRGIYWEIQGWVECHNNIFHKNIPSAIVSSSSSSSSTTFAHIVNTHTHKHEMKMCPRCNLHFGISMEHNLSSSPIIWNSSMSRQQENLSETSEISIVVVTSIMVIIISIGIFYHYKSSVKKFLRGYNITIPEELEKMAESEKLLEESQSKVLPSSNDECNSDDSGRGSFEYGCITPSSFLKKYPSHPILDMDQPMFTRSLPTLSKPYVVCSSPINHTRNDKKFIQSRKCHDSYNISNESQDYARFGVDCLHHERCCQDDDVLGEPNQRKQHEYAEHTGILPIGVYTISDPISEANKKCKRSVNNDHEKFESKLLDNFVTQSEANSIDCVSDSSSMYEDNHAHLILINQDNADIYV